MLRAGMRRPDHDVAVVRRDLLDDVDSVRACLDALENALGNVLEPPVDLLEALEYDGATTHREDPFCGGNRFVGEPSLGSARIRQPGAEVVDLNEAKALGRRLREEQQA